jgi:WD40 repeat protein
MFDLRFRFDRAARLGFEEDRRLSWRRGMNAERAALGFALGLVLGGVAAAQETVRVSVDSAGGQGNDNSTRFGAPSLSADGRFVFFDTGASNLVAGDSNLCPDIFVHDRVTATTERVSVDSSGVAGDGASMWPSVSADGGVVAFASFATNLVTGDTNAFTDIFVHDLVSGGTERVSVDSSGTEADWLSGNPAITADGRWVAFISYARNLVVGDTNGFGDVFVHDRSTGVTERVSIDSSGAEGNGDSGLGEALGISSDGQVIAFASSASNLVAGDTNIAEDVFVHDRSTGITERVSVASNGKQGNGFSQWPALSANGDIVAFHSAASNLFSGDTAAGMDVLVHVRSTGVTEHVSIDSAGNGANGASTNPSLSADGRFVSFGSWASNLVATDTNGVSDVFIHDRSSGITERVSVDSSGGQGNSTVGWSTIRADGVDVAFSSYSTNLVANDTNGWGDVFVHELCSTSAAWFNYGSGFPGTNGIPTFTSQQNPVFGSTITLDLANSYGNPTAGVLFIGFQQTSIHSNWGSDLLVVPAITELVSFSFGGNSWSGDIPDDRSLCGFTVDLQAIEADPGAAKGVSFTQGLELVLGR